MLSIESGIKPSMPQVRLAVILATLATNLTQRLAAGRELFVTESNTQYQSAELLG